MGERDGGTTSPTLLDRVRDRQDHPAWAEFFGRYDPLLRCWCRRFGLRSDDADELCQRTWDRLWPLMQAFQYDPGRRFRGWLWRLFRSRAIDMLADRKATRPSSSGRVALAQIADERADAGPEVGGDEDGPQRVRSTLRREAEAAQAAIRARFDPETWRAFWLTRIEDLSVREVAQALGKSYPAVYYGSLRVEQALRREGERRLDRLMRRVGDEGGIGPSPDDPSRTPA